MSDKPSGQEYFEVSLKKVLAALEKSLDGPGQFIQITSKDAKHTDEGYDELLSRGFVYRFVGWAKDRINEKGEVLLKGPFGEGEGDGQS